jgi:hypothetical protein
LCLGVFVSLGLEAGYALVLGAAFVLMRRWRRRLAPANAPANSAGANDAGCGWP